MKKHFIYTVPLIIVYALFLQSCEYQLKKENFVDLAKPSENRVFDLKFIPEMDTIGIYFTAELSYNFQSDGLQTLETEITIDGKTVNQYTTNKFKVDPSAYGVGFHSLSIVIYTNSGTGSIADLMKAEGYRVEKKWVLYLNPNPVVSLAKSTTSDGYLKISWNRLKAYGFSSFYYSFYSPYYSEYRRIYSQDSTYVIIKNYVGGYGYFQIQCEYTSENYSNLSATITTTDSLPVLHFDDLRGDSLRISWKKSPYRAMYKLESTNGSNQGVHLNWKKDTSVVIPQNYLGMYVSYVLSLAPLSTGEPAWKVQGDFQNHSLGKRVANNWPDFGYNTTDDVIYTNNYDQVLCFDAKTMGQVSSYTIRNLIYNNYSKYFSAAVNSSKMAVASLDSIYVFPDKTLTNPVIIPYSARSLGMDHFYLTDNDLIAIAGNGVYHLVSISQKKIIASLPIVDYPVYSIWASFSTSRDGRFLCVVTRNGTKIFEYTNGSFTPLYAGTEVYRSVWFSSDDPDKLFLTSNLTNVMELRSVNGFTLEKTFLLPASRDMVRNIDPVTGLLLTTDYYNLFVTDLNSGKILFQCKVGDMEYRPYLFHNQLLSTYASVLNITKYTSP